MRFIIRLTVSLALALTLIMTGCSSQGPVGPETGSENPSPADGRPLPADEGAWQTVDLIWCGDEVSGQTPTGQLRYHIRQDLIFEGAVQARDLLPDYEYLLAVVGQPDLPGETDEYIRAGVVFYDDDAPYPYTGLPTLPGGARGEEEYCDFALVITDQHGGLRHDIRTTLPDGLYQVSFVIKDAHLWTHFAATGNFDTEVMRHDDIRFQIDTHHVPTVQ
jgi:hypothetical protein